MDDSGKQSDANPNFRDEKGRFLPGNPGSPGRPKGSRHVLEEDVVAAFAAEFKRRGEAAVSRLEDKELCDLAIKILPKESKIDVGEHFADLLTRAADVLANRGK